MKRYDFELDAHSIGNLFEPIRSKESIIRLLMKIIKHISIFAKPKKSDVIGNMCIVVHKMSRVYLFANDKYFSVVFPFTVEHDNENGFRFYTKDGFEINSKTSSEILSIINEDKILERIDLYDFMGPLVDCEEQANEIWSILKFLMTEEDGYLRYDYDPDPNRLDEKYHPLNHIDFNYSSNATYKIGLYNQPAQDWFIDLTNIRRHCNYIEK